MIALLTTAANAQYGCISFNPERGQHCGRSSSLSVEVRNNCEGPKRVWLCLRQKSGIWNCGLDFSLGVNERTSNFVCDSWGYDDVDVQYCDPNANCRKPH